MTHYGILGGMTHDSEFPETQKTPTYTVSDAEVEAAARALVQYESSGCCTLGIVCDLCDCFLTPETIDEDTQRQKDRARHILTAARSALPEAGTVEGRAATLDDLLKQSNRDRDDYRRRFEALERGGENVGMQDAIRACLALHVYASETPSDSDPLSTYLWCVCGWRSDHETDFEGAGRHLQTHLTNAMHHAVRTHLRATLVRTTPPTPPSEAGDVEAAVAAERERVAVAIEMNCYTNHPIQNERDVTELCDKCTAAARIARTPTATEGG